ncbi:hypothetical protein [Nocardia sp. NPDC052112]|uniref:hypothetical protein n=1 Tax=Nocardia sp. NPDC052112 TaxID=3155646 RepID=UPI003426BB91
MLTAEQKAKLSDVLRPTARPQELTGVYTDDQRRRMLDVVRENGPWKLIIAQHFASGEELIATMSGSMPDGVTPTLDMYLTPTFRGYFAEYGAVLYPEIHDCFYNATFIEHAKRYWKVEYAKPEMMLFNINGPCGNQDPGHLDSPSFRGMRFGNTPTWLLSVMGKSGLFRDYLIKMAQVITWFCHDENSGFTYWPEGPLKAPQRLLPPTYNKGVVVQNEMMVHRGEANGPLDQRQPKNLAFDTVFAGDSSDNDQWLLRTGDTTIARHHTDELRFLVHWNAEVFTDFDELKKNMDGTADLTLDQVFDTFAKDLKNRGIPLDLPTEPLHDRDFIRTLSNAYDLGIPAVYPDEAKPDWMLVA